MCGGIGTLTQGSRGHFNWPFAAYDASNALVWGDQHTQTHACPILTEGLTKLNACVVNRTDLNSVCKPGIISHSCTCMHTYMRVHACVVSLYRNTICIERTTCKARYDIASRFLPFLLCSFSYAAPWFTGMALKGIIERH